MYFPLTRESKASLALLLRKPTSPTGARETADLFSCYMHSVDLVGLRVLLYKASQYMRNHRRVTPPWFNFDLNQVGPFRTLSFPT